MPMWSRIYDTQYKWSGVIFGKVELVGALVVLLDDNSVPESDKKWSQILNVCNDY